jgi:5-bromo-4-chloroindolyl phosphate hydrolysis protein
MKTLKVPPGHYRVLQNLTRKEISILKKHPRILLEARQLIRTCKKVIKRVESISEYASRRKRQTAYKRIVAICQKAVDRAEK